MKNKLKYVLKYALSVVLSFVFIYLFVFFGGYKLFESGDVILQELGVSVVIGSILFVVFEFFNTHSKEIQQLEERISELEEKSNKS